ncbi:hypothetical protein ACFE04_000097 [Oxalis oulophora]
MSIVYNTTKVVNNNLHSTTSCCCLLLPFGLRQCQRPPPPKKFLNFQCLGYRGAIMNRLTSSARLMLVSDLDMTMVDHEDSENESLFRFNSLWEASYRHDSLLVFSTGRSQIAYERLWNKRPLLTPDVTITSVGTEISYGESMVQDDEWTEYLSQGWSKDLVVEETSKFPELVPQEETEQRPLKVSFCNLDKAKALEIIPVLSRLLEERGLDVKIIYSGGTALDVLPKRADKGLALAYLLKKLNADGKPPLNTLVCGDSGNDTELFNVPGVHGVVVSNALEELLQWHDEFGKKNPKIIRSTERCAGAILQAIGNFSLGPNVSPRDITDFQNCKVENFNPAHEVVNFYLFYERWRGAKVEKSTDYVQNLNQIFYSSGTFVHPSGVEKPFTQCIADITKLYGDQQGRNYRVWLDRVSSVQISPDTWLLKFYKWESFEGGKRCCLTTAILKESEIPDSFTWMHIHQTWLEGTEPKEEPTWLF